MPATIWPLNDLVVSTPRLTLRYLNDELSEQIAELAAAGIHDPATMPFSEPWTDVPSSLSMTRPRWEILRRNDIEITGLRKAREFLGL